MFGPDLHCYNRTHSRTGPDGVPSRLTDWRRSAREVLGLAKSLEIDLYLNPGDNTLDGHPDAQEQIDLVDFFESMEKQGTVVVGILGNHDPAGEQEAGPVDLLAKFRPLWGVTVPRIVDVNGVQIACLPHARPDALRLHSETIGQVMGTAQAALNAICWGLATQIDPKRPAILLGHWAISGCKTGNTAVLEGREPLLAIGELQSQPWTVVAMGHIHIPQQFDGSPYVIHTGALERRNFGEQRDERKVAVFDTSTGELAWHSFWSRRFLTWRLTDDEVTNLAGGAPVGPAPTEAEDAICQIEYRATQEQQRKINETALIKALYDAGAHLVTGAAPEILRVTRSRSEGLSAQTSTEEGLEIILAKIRIDLSPELRAACLAAHQELDEEVTKDETAAA